MGGDLMLLAINEPVAKVVAKAVAKAGRLIDGLAG